ncbi:hypothetical protein ACIP4Y_32710 [Streptomyces sp. NPDC088810]|uniref:hypothetical protein n=1 Tax=Streptomyces sp. NPDC088810 TaxID=3365904 RepID=UPI0037FBDDCD
MLRQFGGGIDDAHRRGHRTFLTSCRVLGEVVDITREPWARIAPLIDARAFKYRTGTPWMDLPERGGSWKGVHNRLRPRAADGT